MLKKILVILLFCLWAPLISQTAISRLAQGVSEDIINLLQSPQPVLAVVDFKDNSYLSDQEAQTLYQLLAMKLEQSGRVVFRDLMVDFSGGRGRFNFSDVAALRYSIYLIILDTPDGIGLAASIRLVDSAKLVGLVYRTVPIEPEELWAVSQTLNPGASAELILGLSESYRIDGSIFTVFQDLASEADALYALSPDFLVVWQGKMPNQGVGEKISIKWPFPKAPSIENEGRISTFSVSGQRYLALGSNFSSHSLIVPLGSTALQVISTLPFIPIVTNVMGGESYLVGSRYVPGTNSYDGVMHFLNLSSWDPEKDTRVKAAQKRIDPFYDLALSQDSDFRLNSVYTVGDEYILTLKDSEWNSLIPEQNAPASGANLVVVNGKWLLTSGTEIEGDSLNLYDIDGGGLRFVGSKALKGRVHSISQGRVNGQTGVWVLRHELDSYRRKITWLDFWRVSHEEK